MTGRNGFPAPRRTAPARRRKQTQAERIRAARQRPEAPAEPAERSCRVCGCTDAWGCDEGCEWVEADLCSACVEA